eukprot:m.97956 g.97956  ORF g.97956 m.97956 type:complete len:54 (-) comp51378_c0_seq2:59-220(-)
MASSCSTATSQCSTNLLLVFLSSYSRMDCLGRQRTRGQSFRMSVSAVFFEFLW